MVKLSTEVKVSYSEAERRMFDLLPVGIKNAVTVQDLLDSKQESANGAEAPFRSHAMAGIRATIGNLSRKIEANEEPFRVMKSARAGPHPINFWIEKA